MQAISNVFSLQDMANKCRKPTQQILSVRWQTEISNLTTCFMVSKGNLGRRALTVKEYILFFHMYC